MTPLPRLLALLAIVAAFLYPPSAGAQAPAPHPSRTLVEYGKALTLTGSAPAGAAVALEANRFPFRAGYHRVGLEHATAAGGYSFSVRPSHATRYRVVATHNAEAQTSAAVSVYVNARLLTLTCNLCTGTDSPGAHTLTVDYSAVAPPGKLAARGPVYLYYGLMGGADPPVTVSLVKRVSLHRNGHTLSYTATYSVDFPATAFQFRVVTCFRNVESKDGVGLPGHHHCGTKTLTRQQYLGYLG